MSRALLDVNVQLALATAHHGRFVTFDRSVVRSSVYGATAQHLTVL